MVQGALLCPDWPGWCWRHRTLHCSDTSGSEQRISGAGRIVASDIAADPRTQILGMRQEQARTRGARWPPRRRIRRAKLIQSGAVRRPRRGRALRAQQATAVGVLAGSSRTARATVPVPCPYRREQANVSASPPTGPSAAVGSQRPARAASILFRRARPDADAEAAVEADSAVISARTSRARNPTAGRAATVTQTGFMIIYERPTQHPVGPLSARPNPRNVRRARLPSVRGRKRS